MINHAVPGTIESKLINIKKPLNVFQIKENLSQAIKGATQIGCVIVSITPPLIMEKREHIILGMIWQVLKVFYFFFIYFNPKCVSFRQLLDCKSTSKNNLI